MLSLFPKKHRDGGFVPWWYGFKRYWNCWKDESFYLSKPVGWSIVIRTPFAMLHIAKRAACCDKDGLETGVAVFWFPTRWSLRFREWETLYRHKREWMNFTPRMAIRGLR